MRKLFFVNFQNTPLFFLSCFVQRLGNLLRDALPIFLVFCPRISFQRGIAQVRCLTGPHLELALGHQAASDAGEIFFVRPLMHFPDIVVLYLASETAVRADLTAGLAVLPRRRVGTIGIPFLNQTNVIDQSGGFQRFDQ